MVKKSLPFVVCVLLSLMSCSSMRLEYGFSTQNRTRYTKTIIRNDSGQVVRVVKDKSIYPHRTHDAAMYDKQHIIHYDRDGKITADTIQERIFSIWGNDHIKGRCRIYNADGTFKTDTFESKQNSWL